MRLKTVHGGTFHLANKNITRGAEPVGEVHSLQIYQAQSAVYAGDFVAKNAAGTVAQAAATSPILGVAMHYAAAGADVLVADDPDQVFVIEADGATPAAQTDLGLNYDITVGSANTTYKRSAMQLASASGAVTATLPLRLIRIDRSVDNAFGTNAKCIVRINNHQNGSGTGVAGV